MAKHKPKGKVKTKLKAAVHKVKGKAHAAVQKAKKVAGKVKKAGKEAALLALFAPFAPLAIIYLKSRGVKPAKGMKALALQVHNERTKKSFGFVEGGDLFSYGLTDANEYGLLDLLGVEHAEFGIIPITPDMIMGVISFLKDIFQKIKDKKDKGEPLSENEKAIADAAPAIDAGLTDAKEKADLIVKETDKAAATVEAKGNTEAAAIVKDAGGSTEEAAAVINDAHAAPPGVTPDAPKPAAPAPGDANPSNWKIGLAVLVLVVLILMFKRK